jgi:hypothetical protein
MDMIKKWKQEETRGCCCSLPAATLLLLLSACQHNQGEFGKCGMVFPGFHFIVFKVYFLM